MQTKRKTWRIIPLLLLGIVCLNAYFFIEPTWFFQWYEDYQNGRQKGFVSRYCYDQEGKKQHYTVFVPYGLKPQDKPPLILHLHGAGKRGTDGVKQLRDGIATTIWERKRNFPFVVLFPHEPEDKFWTNDNQLVDKLINLLDSTIRDYHVDPDRVSIAGLSSGGNASWKIASDYPDRFAAIIPFSSSSDEETMLKIARANIPIWSFYVRGDGGSTGQHHRLVYQKHLKEGYSPHITELNGNLSETWSKHNSWDYAARSPSFLKWLLKQNRKVNQSPKKSFRLIFQDYDSTKWQLPDKQWILSEEHILSHHHSAKEENPPLVYQNEYPNYDLHLEFKVEKGSGCCVNFFLQGKKENSDYLEVRIVPPEQGSGGIIRHSDRKWIQTENRLSQQAFRKQEWNDLRIRVFKGALSMTLNGEELYSLECDRTLALNNHFALEALSEEESLIQWRYMRIREIAQ